jgi:hypothetical protein
MRVVRGEKNWAEGGFALSRVPIWNMMGSVTGHQTPRLHNGHNSSRVLPPRSDDGSFLALFFLSFPLLPPRLFPPNRSTRVKERMLL